jgi:hypothetical protein
VSRKKSGALDFLLDGAHWFDCGDTIECSTYGGGSSRAVCEATAAPRRARIIFKTVPQVVEHALAGIPVFSVNC